MHQISFTTKPEDVEALVEYEFKHIYKSRNAIEGLFTSVQVSVIAFLFLLWKTQDYRASLFIGIPLFLLIFFAYPSVALDQKRNETRQHYKEYPEIAFSPQRLEYGGDYLLISNSVSETTIHCSAIFRIRCTQQHAFLYFDPYQAFIVPLSELSASERKLFLSFLGQLNRDL